MRSRTSLIAILVAAVGPAAAQSSLQLSHIEAHVPEEKLFSKLLTRDLLAYFKANVDRAATTLEFRLLRDAATQSGVSYKFYAWVQVHAGTTRVAEGAVRLAAIDRTRFEITDFVSKAKAKQNRDLLQSSFPHALIPSILQLAAE